ncbi:Transcriptional regulator, TetR family OS=Tsukamurella paurometabola (strain ATCC 8368 / DSM/ CCUG 35730 / CIP 100753 / JCM 10117 / KCTC 9821 / NBRC 16120/ NCIMB 702349 / NCTC 13040) OX=521096 GN=Tpau_2894 PE=4 SV=1 [Tsukamurella paurometabola]|uniref:Transcriptional regulator, TetR family n=1 Tax=Tsukamurella paurometabola (strain ATCC 8368 / DSM 20162 / CCUG 35730 / CIP 100753 / JCM 10117 / KCTC 9821 / NBRC 16120 / NCIMB 702349 / NCTC 13040) TaxID=521096 RepID=D5UTY9_TSUPD|nr:TetR/AcrR family transcriptional regulator [Tsukamurella paurometabola]ADG79492.1 transcriptional regulator, TetR family [Tsukamurella paurometabola DSM 20162]SUP35965.1 HTH-type transcriptional repressor KstR2 [Tsukamurella paurometabola]
MARIPAAERRSELVDAAVRVIAIHGVDGATTRRIADAANAPLATLHYCFSSKEELFAEVFRHVAGQYRDVLARNDCHGDVKETARSLMRGVMQWYVANEDFGRAIIELISWARRQANEQAVMVYTEANASLRGILEADAAAAGQSPSDEAIDELAYVVTVLTDGFAMNWLVFADRDAASAHMDLAVRTLDAWMDANLDPGDSRSPASAGALLSWVDVD